MMRGVAMLVWLPLAGCASLETLPPLERAEVECAVKALSNAKGVDKVEVETGLGSTPLIIRYDYSERDGTRRSSRLQIDGWAPPGKPVDYYYQLIDDDYMRKDSSIADVRELMGDCALGMTVVTD